MYRDRRKKIRRVFEVGEILPNEKENVKQNIIYRWRPFKDEIAPADPSTRLLELIRLYADMSDADLKKDLAEKKEILEWFVKKDIRNVEELGVIISQYYNDPAAVLKMVRSK
jgi:hypothetical protein